MSHLRHLAVLAAAALLGAPSRASAQVPPFRLIDGWAQLPQGVTGWGQTIGVEVDPDDNLWVFHRCFGQDCVGPRANVPAVLQYDPFGRLLRSWGQGTFVWPHGFLLDEDGNVWTTDARGGEGKGHTVTKYSPDGRVLMTLGTPGQAGRTENMFNGPADVAVAPNGDIFVADGHGNDRIVKFSPTGEFIMDWGTEGSLLGEFNEPHSLAFDSRGRLFIGDRMNQRIQIYDQAARFLGVIPAIMASGLYITEEDIIYVADYQLREGIVILRASDLQEIGFIPEGLGEGVTVDSRGDVYVAEVIYRNLKKFTRRQGS